MLVHPTILLQWLALLALMLLPLDNLRVPHVLQALTLVAQGPLPQAHVSAVAQDQILLFKEQQVSTIAAALKWPLNPRVVFAVLEATPPYCPPRSSKGLMLAARLPWSLGTCALA